MDCIECKATNSDSNRFCGQCGAELGRSLEETVRKKGFRDRQATEMEITESVVARLMKWATWLGSTAGVIVVLFGLLLGKSCQEVRTTVRTGNAEIETAVREGKQDIDVVRQATTGLNKQLKQIQSDAERYQQVNGDIAKLQKQITTVQGQIVDLGKRGLKASSLEVTGPGPGYIVFKEIGCQPLEKGAKAAYCVQGSPPFLFQVTSKGRAKTGIQSVSSRVSRRLYRPQTHLHRS